jgi:hypothetical protein
MAACVWQAASVEAVGAVITTTGAFGTVKVALQDFIDSQSLVTVQVTIFVPPQASGAPVLLWVITALHPPVKLVVPSQFEYKVLMSDWVRQVPTVISPAQLIETAGAAVTVKVEFLKTLASQLLVAVQVTVTLPPQALGAAPALLVTTRLHPPL